MILHLMSDNQYNDKVISMINEKYISEKNFFLIITNEPVEKISKENLSKSNVEVLYVPKGIKKAFALRNTRVRDLIGSSSAIFIQYMTNWAMNFVNKYVTWQKVYWVIWGGDLYSYIDMELYDEETKKIIKKDGAFKKLKRWYVFKQREKVYRKITKVCIQFKGDYNIFKEKCTSSVGYEPWDFPWPVTKIVKIPGDSEWRKYREEYGKLVLVGHSSSMENNHISILKKLAGFERNDFAIVCPVSYGNKEYADQVVKWGRDLFGQRFIPVRDFLSAEKYSELLQCIDVAIFNNYRQQAAGNIIFLLGLHKKIYMRRTSSYEHFTSLGADIKLVDDLDEETFFDIPEYNIDQEISKMLDPKTAQESYVRIIESIEKEQEVAK